MKAMLLIAVIIATAGCAETPPPKFNIGEKACLKVVGGEFLITWRLDTVSTWWYRAHSSKGQKIEVQERFLESCNQP